MKLQRITLSTIEHLYGKLTPIPDSSFTLATNTPENGSTVWGYRSADGTYFECKTSPDGMQKRWYQLTHDN